MPPTNSSATRLRIVFPGGFDKCSSSSSAAPFRFAPEQLYESLIGRQDPETPIESIIVRFAWYGKQTKGVRHEFIVIQVEDIRSPGLVNFLTLDRNVETPRQSKGVSAMSSQSMNAEDTFRISYDGDVKKLLKCAKLDNYRLLEMLSFPSDPSLRLDQLVILADVVSKRYPSYSVIDSSCYLFAGAIWECIRRFRPLATCQNDLTRERGKCRWFRYVPNASAIEGAHREFLERLSQPNARPQQCSQIQETVNLTTVDEDSRESEL